MFENHRDIINAIFEVYYEMGEVYLKEFYNEKEVNKIKDEAKDRVEKQYGIGKYDDHGGRRQSERERAALQEMTDAKDILQATTKEMKK